MNLLYRWPSAAKLESRVPKEKFYAHGTVTAAVREKFVTEVQRITWVYKLAEATVHLAGSDAVPEIQVFQIESKGDGVSEQVLTAIDKAIPFPIIFEIIRDKADAQSIRMVAAHKQLGAGALTLSAYFSTGWQPAGAARQPMPIAITLPALYTSLFAPLIPVSTLPGEEMSAVAARLQSVRKLEREITALQRRLRTEPQLNRKIELRRILTMKQAKLEERR